MESEQPLKSGQRSKGGKREDLDDRYFRSAWEANYARYLNFLVANRNILKWEYETVEFEFTEIKRGVRFYKPDFKIYENNGKEVFHEVKGYYDSKTITRHKRMKKYYPEIKIIMIDADWFKRNSKKLKVLIKNWE